MAKGGGKRTYARDSRGRFASTPSSAAKKAAKSTSSRTGTLGARTGLKTSRAKLKAKDRADQTLQNTLSTRAQKGAVTRGSQKLASVKTAAQTRISGGRRGVIGKPRGLKAGPVVLQTKKIQAGKPLGGDQKRIVAPSIAGAGGRMKPPVTLKRMQQIGGSRWQKGNMDRVYFNNIPERAGLEVDRYKSGNISDASLKGKGISNSKAKEIFNNLSDSKVFYDRKAKKMLSQGPYNPAAASYGRSRQKTTAQALLKSVANRLARQSRIKPTLRANQKLRRKK